MLVLPSEQPTHSHGFPRISASGEVAAASVPCSAGTLRARSLELSGSVGVALILGTRPLDSVRGIPSTRGSSLLPGGAWRVCRGKGCLNFLEAAALCRGIGCVSCLAIAGSGGSGVARGRPINAPCAMLSARAVSVLCRVMPTACDSVAPFIARAVAPTNGHIGATTSTPSGSRIANSIVSNFALAGVLRITLFCARACRRSLLR